MKGLEGLRLSRVTQDGKKKVSYLVNWKLFTFGDGRSGLLRWQWESGEGGGGRFRSGIIFVPFQDKLNCSWKERGQYLFKSISLSVCLCPRLFPRKEKKLQLCSSICWVSSAIGSSLDSLHFLLPMKRNFKRCRVTYLREGGKSNSSLPVLEENCSVLIFSLSLPPPLALGLMFEL